ncbi:1193_t:CDS:1, partial [Entrophospora sp. SA101]
MSMQSFTKNAPPDRQNCKFESLCEIKARLEETHTDFEATEQTIRNELSRLGYVATLPRHVPLLTKQAKQNR